MIGFVLLVFPFLLLGFVLLMERVEEPLSQAATEREMERFLEDANREELNTFVREGPETAVSGFRRRLRFTRFRRGSARAGVAARAGAQPADEPVARAVAESAASSEVTPEATR